MSDRTLGGLRRSRGFVFRIVGVVLLLLISAWLFGRQTADRKVVMTLSSLGIGEGPRSDWVRDCMNAQRDLMHGPSPLFNQTEDRPSESKCDGFNKIFVIGFPKSGTSSITDCLKAAGISTAHLLHESQPLGVAMMKSLREGKLMLSNFPENLTAYTQMDVLLQCEHKKRKCKWNAWPQLVAVPVLDLQYPCSKFILNKRSINDHINSINKWRDFRRRIVENDLPFLPRGKGSTDCELASWIQRHYDAMEAYFQGRPRDFLAIDIDREFDFVESELKEFLGLEDLKWTRSNANPKARD